MSQLLNGRHYGPGGVSWLTGTACLPAQPMATASQSAIAPDQAGSNPLLHDAWLAFNQQHSGVRPLRVDYRLPGRDLPRLRGVLYLGRGGRVLLPRLNQELPFSLTPSADKPGQAAHDWLALAPLLVTELQRRGLHSAIAFPLELVDMRPFTWAGLRAGVGYSTVIDFPYDLAAADGDVRRRAAKAERDGFHTRIHAPVADLLACLSSTEARKGIALGLTAAKLTALLTGLGPAVLRSYVTYAPDGRPAAGSLVLLERGGRAQLWVAGNMRDFLPSGAAQLNFRTILADVQAQGASHFDFNGASIRSVALAKEAWGGRLVPQYTVEQYNLRNLVRDAWRMVRRPGN